MSSISSAPQRFPYAGWPLLHVEPVMVKEGERDALQAEADAGGVRNAAVFEIEAPFRAEGILMVVEAHAGGRIGDRGDRDQQFELQVLVALIVGKHLAGA